MTEDANPTHFLPLRPSNRRPTPLDARLFALLHTILSLPVPSKAIIGSTPGASLRAAVERHPTLGAWTRRVWREWVRSRGG